MEETIIRPRFAEAPLEEALGDSPVVLLQGPRQCGKTTLARIVGARRGHEYTTFDDSAARSAAEADPTGFVERLARRCVLDEVQQVPGIFAAIKQSVDTNREPGRFLLTGSSQVLLLPTLADSLAGRMSLLRLHPFAQSELEQRQSRIIEALFAGDFATGRSERLREDLSRRVVDGGYPDALARRSPARRAAWYRDYVETIVQRDVRELSRVSSLDALPRLLAVAAGQTARLLNVSKLAGPFQSSQPTIDNHLTLLERVFLVERVSPWHRNRLSRLVRTPKLHLGDCGVAAALLGLDAESAAADREVFGQLVETFVYQELRRQASGLADETRFHHFRDRDRYEVDIVLERGPGRVVGVEVKAGASVASEDLSGLRRLARAAGQAFKCGVVFCDVERTMSFGDRLFAVPIRSIWETR